MKDLKSIELVEKERIRQIEQEGFSMENDLKLNYGELALAGVCYATPIQLYQKFGHVTSVHFLDPYPWSGGIGDKRKDYQKTPTLLLSDHDSLDYKEKLDLLTKGAALICAEIDRLITLNDKENGQQE